MPSNTQWWPRIAPEEKAACPWCDGAGKYARSHRWIPASGHTDIEWVPCGYCQASGVA